MKKFRKIPRFLAQMMDSSVVPLNEMGNDGVRELEPGAGEGKTIPFLIYWLEMHTEHF